MNDSTQKPSKLLVVIPCLNESENIRHVIADIPNTLDRISSIEVLVIDDGSTDNTAEIARNAGAKVISHSRNKGVGAAFGTACQYAIEGGYDMMVNIDGDRQFDPADILKLVEPVITGVADMTTASRFIDGSLTPQMPKVKLWGNQMMSKLISALMREKFYDVSCGFRCYGRESLLHLNLQGSFTYTQESFIDLLSKHLRIMEVPIVVKYYPDRRSRVAGSVIKYALSTSKIIFRSYRDYFPLRFFWSIALMCLVPGVFFGLLFLFHFLATSKFSGYLFCGFSSAFLSILALIFFIVGLVADMLVRVRKNQEKILYLLKKNS